MSKLTNAILMLNLLSSKRKYSIKELAKELEVSERMIREYKYELEVAGIYIDTIRGPYGGYVLNSSIHFGDFIVTKDEIEMLREVKIKLSKGEKLNNDGIFKYCTFVDKIKIKQFKEFEVIPSDTDERKKFNDINRCCIDKHKIFIKYLGYDKEISERIIHPYEMFRHSKNDWFVASFCEKRNSIRHFKLNNILEYEVLDTRFI